MAIVKFSQNFLRGSVNSLQGYMVNLGNQSYQLGVSSPNGGASPQVGYFSAGRTDVYSSPGGNIGLLRAMSGTRPANIETLTTTTNPAGTTMLWQAYALTNLWAPTGQNWFTDPTSLSSIFIQAANTGVASWFWLCTPIAGRPGEGGQSFPDPSPIYHNITGDIGIVGSNSDMEMVSTQIVAGQFVRVLNINIGMSVSFY